MSSTADSYSIIQADVFHAFVIYIGWKSLFDMTGSLTIIHILKIVTQSDEKLGNQFLFYRPKILVQQ